GGRYGCRAVADNQASPRPVVPVQPALGKAEQARQVSHVGGRYGCRAVADNQASPRPVVPVQPALGKADQQAC
ncbi:hypothetical protein, partial [Aeromonas caviae]|uniref:hypothetical protein n=1 Tax=Aeromonas caviae TaxID=648 RepID=UPI002B4966BE